MSVLVELIPADAGELLTLQRAAYITEARAHSDLNLPPLVESITEVESELADHDVIALGIRDAHRLVAAVRVRLQADHAELGRLIVAPDRQGNGLGTRLMKVAESRLPGSITEVRLFTGEFSTANLRLYERNGYHETHRTNVGRYDLVHLVKELAPHHR